MSLPIHTRLPVIIRNHPSTTSRLFTTSRILRQTSEKDTKVSANYTRPPVPRSSINGSKLPVYPIIFLFVAGTLAFNYLAKSRAGQGSSHYVLPTRDNQSTREQLYKKTS